MPTLGVFAAIVDDIGRILCVRMNYATRAWTTPGGRVEAGESPLHGLQREVPEESGFDVIADGLVGVYCKPYKAAHAQLLAHRSSARNARSRKFHPSSLVGSSTPPRLTREMKGVYRAYTSASRPGRAIAVKSAELGILGSLSS